MTRPRIGINLLWLTPGAAGGAEEYAVRLLRALAQEAADALDITIFCHAGFVAAHADLCGRFATAVAPWGGEARPVRILAESTWLPREASRARLHLIHHTNMVVPWIRDRPSVLTIHDLRPLVLPDSIGRAQGGYLRARLRPSVRHAAVITTPSSFVRETVIDLLGADPDRVRVVSAPLFAPEPGLEGAVELTTGARFVYPAITNPHKNHRTLLEAFAAVATARADAVLVLTGAPGPAEAGVADAIQELGLAGRVRRRGRVPAAELDALYRGAAALVYPSTYEGFGLPLAEAMAAGCPVIASDRAALPEVAGDAAILLDPFDVDGWADAMLRLVDDDGLRTRLIAAGRERVRSLTPAAAARQQVEAYRAALDIARLRADRR